MLAYIVANEATVEGVDEKNPVGMWRVIRKSCDSVESWMIRGSVLWFESDVEEIEGKKKGILYEYCKRKTSDSQTVPMFFSISL